MSLPIYDFAKLFLAKLADNSDCVHLWETAEKYARIPFNYRERIQNIILSDNGWKEEFSVLIDMDSYLENHFVWEQELSYELIRVAKKFNQEFKVDMIGESIYLAIPEKKLNKILNNYDDVYVVLMDHFVNLVLDAIYTRDFQECFTDYTSISSEKMQDINDCVFKK